MAHTTKTTGRRRSHWGQSGAEPVVIAATIGFEKGIWFRVREGIRGLLVRDERGIESAYMMCEPASHYFQVMTRSTRMSVLFGERILFFTPHCVKKQPLVSPVGP
jgi:hypothetical protein